MASRVSGDDTGDGVGEEKEGEFLSLLSIYLLPDAVRRSCASLIDGPMTGERSQEQAILLSRSG